MKNIDLNAKKTNHPKGRLITNLKKKSDETDFIFACYVKSGLDLGLKVEMFDDAYCSDGKLISSLCAIVITSEYPNDLSEFHRKCREYRALDRVETLFSMPTVK